MALLKYLNLSDRYEIKTRVLPGLIVGFPVSFGVLAFANIPAITKEGLAISSLLFAALIFWIAHLARHAGTIFEKALVRAWGGLPTTRWLRPNDDSRSPEQKAIWTKALASLSGIELGNAITGRSNEDIDKLILDAVLSARGKLRKSRTQEAKFLQKTNEEYGFARNLGGMKWAAVTSGILGLVLASVAFYLGKAGPAQCAISSLLAVAMIVQFRGAESHACHCAERYAEAFYAAVQAARKS